MADEAMESVQEPIHPVGHDESLSGVRGSVRRIARPALVASLAATLPLLWFVSAGTPEPGDSPRWLWPVLAAITILGLLGLAAAAIAFLHFAWRAGQARRAGVDWLEIAEAAGGDHGFGSSVAFLLLAFLPLPCAIIGAAIAPGGIPGRLVLWLVALGPALLIGLFVGRRDRLGAIERPRAGKAKVLGLRAATTVLALVVLIAVGIGTFALAIGFWTRQIRASYGPQAEQLQFPNDAARHWRIPPDRSLPALEAGRALDAVMSAGLERPRDTIRRATGMTLEKPWLPDDAARAVGVGYPAWPSELIRDAADGLDPVRKASLTAMTPNDGAALLTALSRAGEADLIAARYRLPFRGGTTVLDLPPERYTPTHFAALSSVGRAALRLDAGDRPGAERLLREVVSLGVLLHDEAMNRGEAAAATAVARIGLVGLVTLFEVEGRTADASGIRTSLQATPRAVDPRIIDRGPAWDAIWQTTVEDCIDLPALVFGPPADYEADVQERARRLIRRSSDMAWLELLAGRSCTPLSYL